MASEFPNVQRLVDLIGQLQGFDLTSILQRLDPRARLAFEQFYWEEPDFLFLAIVKEIVDATHFTFTWRGRVLWARAIPTTGDLEEGETALIRKLPGSREYFTITKAKILVVVGQQQGNEDEHRVIFTYNPLTAVWHLAPYILETDNGGMFTLDNVKSLMGYHLGESHTGSDLADLYRTRDVRVGPWQVILDEAMIKTLTGTNNDRYRIGRVTSSATLSGFIATTVSARGFGTQTIWVFRSLDNGDNWSVTTVIPLSNDWTVGDILIDPLNAANVYLSLHDANTDEPQFWASFDGAISFARIDDGSFDGIVPGSELAGAGSFLYSLAQSTNFFVDEGTQGVSWEGSGEAEVPDEFRVVHPNPLKLVAVWRNDGSDRTEFWQQIAGDAENWAIKTPVTADGNVTNHPQIGIWKENVYVVGVESDVGHILLAVDDSGNAINIKGNSATLLGEEFGHIAEIVGYFIHP